MEKKIEDIRVIKRSKELMPFDKRKIEKAVSKAIIEVRGSMNHYSTDVFIGESIAESLMKLDHNATVEEIQDMVEIELVKHEMPKVARAYMRYRDEHKKQRGKPNSDENVEKYIYLTDDFMSKYKGLDAPMSPIGFLTFYRTYSRWLKKRKRRERWYETVRRSVEYNLSLVQHKNHDKAVSEAQELFDNIYNLKQFLSGRTFYSGNTKVTQQFPSANFNCAFTIANRVQAFVDSFNLLLLGCGLGFRALDTDVADMEKFNSALDVIHTNYKEVIKGQRKELTELAFNQFGTIAILTIGDSKKGWVGALQMLMELYTNKMYSTVDAVMINYDNIRPEGEKLLTFGGNASGYKALETIFEKIHQTIQRRKSVEELTGYINIKPIDVLDIQTSIAEGVVVGGTRRSAEIALLGKDDEESIDAKSDLYKKDGDKWVIDQSIKHRQMANNSIYYTEKPSREGLHSHFEKMRYSGEPAWVNAEVGGKRRENFHGVNPCGEILLDNKGFCNLTTINVFAFVNENGELDEEGLFRAQKLSARAGYRMASIEVELHEWDLVQKRDKLVGCSLTGWQDMVNSVGLNKADQSSLLKKLRSIATDAVNEIAEDLGTKPSLLITTVKPEGTLSLLPTVSSGVHYSHSPYYIRRIRISSFNPLCKTMEALGYPMFPEVGQKWEDCKTKVVEFPVKAPQGKTKYDVSAIEQLENYKMFMEDYVDHNCSITVHVRNDEWEEVEEWVWKHWNDVMGVSFLSLDDSFYNLLPYEAIKEEEYDRRMSELKPFDLELYASFEQKEWEEEDLDDVECASGSCPTR